MKPKIPKSIQHEHESLCAELKNVIDTGGAVGEKAKLLRDALAAHLAKEEKYALPPLGLLLSLSEGRWEIDQQEAVKMAEMLYLKRSEMKKDHEKILKYLNDLKELLGEEDSFRTKQFVKDFMLHIELEDQVLYPATILVGNYLSNIKR